MGFQTPDFKRLTTFEHLTNYCQTLDTSGATELVLLLEVRGEHGRGPRADAGGARPRRGALLRGARRPRRAGRRRGARRGAAPAGGHPARCSGECSERRRLWTQAPCLGTPSHVLKTLEGRYSSTDCLRKSFPRFATCPPLRVQGASLRSAAFKAVDAALLGAPEGLRALEAIVGVWSGDEAWTKVRAGWTRVLDSFGKGVRVYR